MQALEGKYTLREAKRACQRKRAILLEFDTRGEVRLVTLVVGDKSVVA